MEINVLAWGLYYSHQMRETNRLLLVGDYIKVPQHLQGPNTIFSFPMSLLLFRYIYMKLNLISSLLFENEKKISMDFGAFRVSISGLFFSLTVSL
jgi:hypothetical protein